MCRSTTTLYHVRIMSDQKVFVCSIALDHQIFILRAKALLQALIITIQPDMILFNRLLAEVRE